MSNSKIIATYSDWRDAFKHANRVRGAYVSGSDQGGYHVVVEEVS